MHAITVRVTLEPWRKRGLITTATTQRDALRALATSTSEFGCELFRQLSEDRIFPFLREHSSMWEREKAAICRSGEACSRRRTSPPWRSRLSPQNAPQLDTRSR